MAKTCIKFDENIVFHTDGKQSWVYWLPEGDEGGSDWHSACTLDEAKFSKEEHQFLLDKYIDILEQSFDRCNFAGHEWGREFNFKGTPSTACKICKTIEPVEE